MPAKRGTKRKASRSKTPRKRARTPAKRFVRRVKRTMSVARKGKSRVVNRQPRTRARSGKVAITGGGVYKVSKNSITMGTQVPNFRNGKHSIIISNREFLTDVLSVGAAFDISDAYPINPGMAQTFPWLHTIANCFEEYILHGVVFYYKSTCGNSVGSTTTSLGTIMMATNYNVSAPAFATKVEMENHEFGMSKKPSLDMIHPIECASKEDVLRAQYIRSEAVASGLDPRFYDHGNFYFATQGQQAASTCGELWISYDIELLKPKTGTLVAPPPPEPCPLFYEYVSSGIRTPNAAALAAIANDDPFGQRGTGALWNISTGLQLKENPLPCCCVPGDPSPGNAYFDVHPTNDDFKDGNTGLLVDIRWFTGIPADTNVSDLDDFLRSAAGPNISVVPLHVMLSDNSQFWGASYFVHDPVGAGPWRVNFDAVLGVPHAGFSGVSAVFMVTSSYNHIDGTVVPSSFAGRHGMKSDGVCVCPGTKKRDQKQPPVQVGTIEEQKHAEVKSVVVPRLAVKSSAKKSLVVSAAEQTTAMFDEMNTGWELTQKPVKKVSEPSSPAAKPKVVSKRASGV